MYFNNYIDFQTYIHMHTCACVSGCSTEQLLYRHYATMRCQVDFRSRHKLEDREDVVSQVRVYRVIVYGRLNP